MLTQRTTRTENFNPRSREGSDCPAVTPRISSQDHFNPRSREGSDIETAEETGEFMEISIHAPAKGATACTSQLFA